MRKYVVGVFNYADGKNFIYAYNTYEQFEESVKSLKKAVKNIVYYEISCNLSDLKQFKDDLRQGNPVEAEAKEYIKEESVEESIPEPVQEIAAKKAVECSEYTLPIDNRKCRVIHLKGSDLGISSLDEATALFAKPRVIPDILAGNAETWVAPVGGCDYVLTKSGRRINMKHSPKDTRYNEEVDGKPCGLSACKYLDLNDIELI